MQKNILSFLFIIVLLLVIAVSVIQNKSLSISDAIYALTALIILWYSYETAIMRNEMIKQNRMLMRPVINLKLDDNNAFYNNDGSGPALNIRVTDFKPTILNKTSTDNTYYEIQPVSYIPQGGNDKIIIHSGNSETRAKGTIPETNMFFGVGKQVQTTIVYEDMEGTEYKTKITTSSGNVSSVSIKRLKSA